MTDRRLAAIQHEHPEQPRRDVPGLLARAGEAVAEGGIAVLPEYFYRSASEEVSAEVAEEADWLVDEIRQASRDTGGALVATVPEVGDGRLHNTAIVVEDGDIRLAQRKLRPTEDERKAGVEPGEELATAEVQGLELGVLVCADVLSLDLVERLARRDPDVVAVPVLSPNRESDTTREARTSVFVARAWDMGAYVVKAGGFRQPDVVGRSLITAPWGLEARARDQFAATVLASEVDEAKLARAQRPFDPLRGREA